MAKLVPVYLEAGRKRVIASARDWPGWCRHGRDEDEALAALFAHGARYGRLIARARLGYEAPARPALLKVVERVPGGTYADFGVPGHIPRVDAKRACDADELARFERLLRALWRGFDATVEKARGKPLATGPRGGGRELERIVAHVLEAERMYIAATGGARVPPAGDLAGEFAAVRAGVLATLRESAAGAIPAKGPRGGTRWPARYLARRAAYHLTSHIWEIERRLGTPPR